MHIQHTNVCTCARAGTPLLTFPRVGFKEEVVVNVVPRGAVVSVEALARAIVGNDEVLVDPVHLRCVRRLSVPSNTRTHGMISKRMIHIVKCAHAHQRCRRRPL